jgi:hypothetical protein
MRRNDMDERKLASIQKIRDIKPIPNADKIELAFVQGWQVIVQKEMNFKIGDLVVYLEIDSKLPKDNPDFAFLEKRNYKIKTIKMRGVLSQGIIFSLSILPKKNWQEGDDVTKILKIKKIEEDKIPTPNNLMRLQTTKKKLMKNPIIKYMMKYEWFRKLMIRLFVTTKKKSGWPKWVSKTDEERCQNLIEPIEEWRKKEYKFIVREKLDGTSTTYTLRRIRKNKYEFIVCSRNMVVGTGKIKADKVDKFKFDNKKVKLFYEENVYTEMADKYDIPNVLLELINDSDNEWVTIQGEIIGEGIQSNKYNIQGRELYLFNYITSNDSKRKCILDADMFNTKYNLLWCPFLEIDWSLPENGVEGLLNKADGMSVLGHDVLREGLVIRNYEHNISFKVISNEFLLKWGL